MRIVVDCRYTRFEHHDGISRFTAGIVRELALRHPVTMLISDHRQLSLLPQLPWQLVSSPTSIREPLVALQVNRLHPDIVFSPMQTMGSWGRRYRLVLTVHDLIYYTNRTPPRDLPVLVRGLWRVYHLGWWPQRLLLNRADAIVTVSQTTARLIDDHRLTRRPVTVVPNAADEFTAANRRRERPRRESYVYMGSFMPYKNVELLVRAIARRPGARLHLMSRIPASVRERLEALAPADSLVFHDGASDQEYVRVLSVATALLSASRAEGFGIPLVEAMRLGTPIVVSDIPIFREIGADAAEYIDPDDVDDLVGALNRLADPLHWSERSAAGRDVAHRFTWARSAERLLALLTETAGASASADAAD